MQYKVILNYVIVKNYPLKRQRNSIYGVQMGGKPTGENYLKKKKKVKPTEYVSVFGQRNSFAHCIAT